MTDSTVVLDDKKILNRKEPLTDDELLEYIENKLKSLNQQN